MNDGKLCTTTIRALIAFIILAMLLTLSSMCFTHEKKWHKTQFQSGHAVVVASDGGPIPTCGPGHPCKPSDDSIVHKIINILIG